MKIVFMGTPEAAVPSLKRLMDDGHEIAAVYTQPDRPAGRGKKLRFSPVKQFSLENDLKVMQPLKIRTAEAVDEFKGHLADIAVVVAYGRILPEAYLNAFGFGAVNVHFSLLPRYRGAAPVNWAIVHGERITGVTTMKMDVGLDTGPILLQKETPIAIAETAIELMGRLSGMGAELLSETIARYQGLSPVPQNEADATFAPIMKKEDGLISWMLTAQEITNRVRGFQPFPTAFSYFKEKKLILWDCEPVDESYHLKKVGEIVEARGDRLEVFCGGDTTLRINELQMEGKRRIPVRDFINGVRPQIGDVFGA